MLWLLLLVAALAGKDAVVAEIGPLVVTTEEMRSSMPRSREGKDDATVRKDELERILDRHAAFLRVRDEVLERDPTARQIWADAWLGRKFPMGDYHWEPEELYAWWEAHKAEFTRPAELNWQWVVVKTTADRDEAAARALAEELRTVGDEQPEWLANSVREIGDPTVTLASGKGRQQGPKPLDAVAELAFSLPESEIVSAVVPTAGGFGFVRLVDRFAPVERDFEEAQRDVKRAMLAEARAQAADEYAKKLVPADVYADPARRDVAIRDALFEEALKMGLDEDASVQRKVVYRWLDLQGITSNSARKEATAKLAKEGREKYPPRIDQERLGRVPLR